MITSELLNDQLAAALRHPSHIDGDQSKGAIELVEILFKSARAIFSVFNQNFSSLPRTGAVAIGAEE